MQKGTSWLVLHPSKVQYHSVSPVSSSDILKPSGTAGRLNFREVAPQNTFPNSAQLSSTHRESKVGPCLIEVFHIPR